VTPTRAVLIGSAVPLLIVVVLTGLGPAGTAVGLLPTRSGDAGGWDPPTPATVPPSPAGDRAGSAARAREEVGLSRLRRSIRAGSQLGFTGTEVVSAWTTAGATTRVLDVVQRPGGLRSLTARAAGAARPASVLRAPSGPNAPSPPTGSSLAAGPGGPVASSSPLRREDGLAVLSSRALSALAARYQVQGDGTDEVAGRPAVVVQALSGGREISRIWLDRATGLLLRQDVFDRSGRLYRRAAFTELHLAPASSTLTGPVATAPATGSPSAVGPEELARLRAEGWPCPVALGEGFILLDARREPGTAESAPLHLTYGDGLSAVSVFLQPGRLAADHLAGLDARRWGRGGDVFVRDGWPQVVVWQGGSTVITVVADADEGRLREVLTALPGPTGSGTLGSWPRRMGSALAWFKS
jgi:MucB/RseB N-terminal domain